MSEPTTVQYETTQTDPELQAIDVCVQAIRHLAPTVEVEARVARYLADRFEVTR